VGIIPDYVGVSAFGIKLGVIVPGTDLVDMIFQALIKCDNDGLLDDGDTVCITESVVARAQDNFVTVSEIAEAVAHKLNLKPDSTLGVVFPILSRNRFSLILKGLAAAVPQGKVIVQLSFPNDEVGNQLLPPEVVEVLGYNCNQIEVQALKGQKFSHPITGVDYMELYQDIIREQAKDVEIIICNDPLRITEYPVDAVVVANIHARNRTIQKLRTTKVPCITLQDICNNRENKSWSEWGLLGSNMSSGDRLKLAPREADELADLVQQQVAERMNKKIEVIVYGDGAYCDPSTGIYELADPQPAFGLTAGLRGKYREGLKYKYLVDMMWEDGVEINEIENTLEARKKDKHAVDSVETEGTTPRKVEDLIASLADLISGSADAGTPLILVKNFINP